MLFAVAAVAVIALGVAVLGAIVVVVLIAVAIVACCYYCCCCCVVSCYCSS